MTKNDEFEVSGFLESKFARIFMLIMSVGLIFIGPTYFAFLLSNVLGVDHFVSMGIGAVLFVVGLVLLIYLVAKKVVT